VAEHGLLAGKQFGTFDILRLLGRGGMGEVYRAQDQTLDRPVALKVLRPKLAQDPAFVERFLREARSVAQLNHPNIVQVYSVGEFGGVYYISMEYVNGASVAEFIKRMNRLEIGQALRVARQTTRALAAAHAKGIIHRDIKPANIMVDQAGRIKVMDFGLAKAISPHNRSRAEGAMLGTPYYMAPEQVQGGVSTAQTDFYSLGVSLFEMLTGAPPFTGKSSAEVFHRIANEEIPEITDFRSDVSPELSHLMRRLSSRKPEARYASVETVLDDIRKAREAEMDNAPFEPAAAPLNLVGALDLDSPTRQSKVDTTATPSRAVLGMRPAALLALVLAFNAAAWIISAFWMGSTPPGNRSLELLERGLPPVEALREAMNALERDDTPENQQIAEEVRRRFIEDSTITLESTVYFPHRLAQIVDEAALAAELDDATPTQRLHQRIQTAWKQFDLRLESLDEPNQSGDFLCNASSNAPETKTVRVGEYINDRFLLQQTKGGLAILEDTAISLEDGHRQMRLSPGNNLRDDS
jgi:serine/threonine protein kinase